MATVDPKLQLSEELGKFQALRAQFTKIVALREQLEVQINENKIVKEVLLIIQFHFTSLDNKDFFKF